ncbi:unnamed protein product [Lampetra fluviatilis]
MDFGASQHSEMWRQRRRDADSQSGRASHGARQKRRRGVRAAAALAREAGEPRAEGKDGGLETPSEHGGSTGGWGKGVGDWDPCGAAMGVKRLGTAGPSGRRSGAVTQRSTRREKSRPAVDVDATKNEALHAGEGPDPRGPQGLARDAEGRGPGTSPGTSLGRGGAWEKRVPKMSPSFIRAGSITPDGPRDATLWDATFGSG